jgi:hypothetical protein
MILKIELNYSGTSQEVGAELRDSLYKLSSLVNDVAQTEAAVIKLHNKSDELKAAVEANS